MTTLGDKQAFSDAEGRGVAARLSRGLCISIDWTNHLAVVNMGGGEVYLPMVGVAPFPGDPVWVGYFGTQPICLGTVPRSATGTVAIAASGGKIGVDGDDGVAYLLPYQGTAQTVGQRVVVDWAAGGVIMASSLISEPTVVEPVPPPTNVTTTYAKTFNPRWSGNYRYGSFVGSNVEISTTRSGYYWYGTQIANSIPDSATILEARVYLKQNWDNVPGVNSLMGTHTHTSVGSQPSLSGSTSVPGGSRWVSLGSIGTSLKTGAVYGIGFYSGNNGWRQYAQAGYSGQVYIKWKV